MKHRVMYVGPIEKFSEQIGYAEPDPMALEFGDLYEGAWYFEPDDKSLLKDDESYILVDETHLSFED